MKPRGSHAARSGSVPRLAIFAAIIVAGLAVAFFLMAWQLFFSGAAADGDAQSAAADAPSGSDVSEGAARAVDSSGQADRTIAFVSLLDAAMDGTGAAEGLSSEAVYRASRDAYTLNPSDVLAIPGSDAIVPVSLNPSSGMPVIDSERLQPVADALATIGENGSCGFVFLDAGSGYGLAYNADEEVYIASSSKAALAYYALLHGAGEQYYQRDSIQSAIVYSDNDAYEAFGYAYFDEQYSDWLEERGVESLTYMGDLYPPMCARSLAGIWAEILLYVNEGTDDALWFGEQLSNTGVSFIRDAVERDDASVMNKAGWIADWEADSVTDAAIIQADGRTYLMVIVTSMPAWESTESSVTDLAAALFTLRDVL